MTPTTVQQPRSGRRRSPRGFTLVELMVSIAMVLIIILGVNAIFKMVSDTVNAGQALSAADRDNRAVQGVLYSDFQSAVITDGPMLLIRSEVVPAFRNAVDEQADRDGNPLTVDMDDNNVEGESGVPGELTMSLVQNSRNHRVDRIAFFANHLYRRQTGTHSSSGSRFLDVGASNEAYIWLGHVDQPDFNSPLSGSNPGRYAHRSPGELPKADNPNNYYATDWILGRSVTLLRETPAPAGVSNPPNYFDSTGVDLSPLGPESKAKDRDADGVQDLFAWSRYDLAQTSINAFRQALSAHITAKGQNISGTDAVWYEILGGEWGTGNNNARFQAYPYPDRPLSPYGVARTVPVFVRGCTQFTVEYAGDYLAQDPGNGAVVGTYLSGPGGVDGQIDFLPVVDQPYAQAAAQSVRRIRWYGMPRNVDTRDDGGGPLITGAPGANSKQENLYDVVPLRDLLEAAGGPAIPSNFFERFEGLDPQQNYASVSGNPKTLRYYAAWGPADLAPGSLTRPKMIRITMTVDDPNGRMTEGQTYEYVIDLP